MNESYTSFAQVYDMFMDNVFADYLVQDAMDAVRQPHLKMY